MDEQIRVDGIPETKITVLATGANQSLELAKQQKVIANNEQLQVVGQELIKIKDIRKQVVDLFADPKKKAHDSHKSICDAESKLLKPLQEAEAVLSRMVSAYNQEVQRKVREEAERLRIEAEKKAAEERKKLEAQALKAIENGNEVKAEALMQQAETVIPIVSIAPVYEAPKVEGLNIRQNWTYEITNANLIPREYLMVDEKKLSGIAKTMKQDGNVPGVRFYDAGSVARAS